MRIVHERPPLFEQIDARFHIAGRPVIFSWGDIIYNPQCIEVTPELMAHERVHGRRQQTWGIERWWLEYIDNDVFRLGEEVLGHRAEYEKLMEMSGSNRKARRTYMTRTAKRLASPLYGSCVTRDMARKLLASAA